MQGTAAPSEASSLSVGKRKDSSKDKATKAGAVTAIICKRIPHSDCCGHMLVPAPQQPQATARDTGSAPQSDHAKAGSISSGSAGQHGNVRPQLTFVLLSLSAVHLPCI